MKTRNFYPKQVLRRLQGEHKHLDAGQLAAVKFTMLKGRKLGIALSMGPTTTAVDLLACTSSATAPPEKYTTVTSLAIHGIIERFISLN